MKKLFIFIVIIAVIILFLPFITTGMSALLKIVYCIWLKLWETTFLIWQ